MAIVKNVEFQGSKVISTNNGDISINQGTGELLIRKNGAVLTRVTSQGFIYSEPDGTRRILIGSHPKDGHVIEAISDPGVDVIQELSR
nr:MAG TPA: hypothetical protein [Caudoviricetes sp.]